MERHLQQIISPSSLISSYTQYPLRFPRDIHDFSIKPSSVHGQGVFTTKDYKAGEWIGVQFFLSSSGNVQFDPWNCNFQGNKQSYMKESELKQCPWRMTNHRCESIMEICHCPYNNNTSKFYPLVATKDMFAGTEIVYNFRRVRDIIDVSFVPDNDCFDIDDDDSSKEPYAELCDDCGRQMAYFVKDFTCDN